MSTTIDIFETSPRRRFMMEKADVILSQIHNPEMLDVLVAKGWTSSPYYMLKREAQKVTSLGRQLFYYKDDVLSLEELRFFTGITGSVSLGGYARNCKILCFPPNSTGIDGDGLRRFASLELFIAGKRFASIAQRNFYQLFVSGYGKQNNRLTIILLNPNAVVSLNSNNTNGAATIKDIYVPDDLVDSYKAADTWSTTYSSKIFGMSDLPSQYLKYVDYYD